MSILTLIPFIIYSLASTLPQPADATFNAGDGNNLNDTYTAPVQQQQQSSMLNVTQNNVSTYDMTPAGADRPLIPSSKVLLHLHAFAKQS